MPYPSNHLALNDLASMAIGEIAALPPEELLQLQEGADAETARVKRLRDRLQAGIAERYGATAQSERTAQGKDTGTVRFQDAGITVAADLPKKVTWDQAQLAAIVERIRAAGDDPAQYVEIAFKVPERKYAAWPEAIRQQFEPARTVHTGALKIAMISRREVRHELACPRNRAIAGPAQPDRPRHQHALGREDRGRGARGA